MMARKLQVRKQQLTARRKGATSRCGLTSFNAPVQFSPWYWPLFGRMVVQNPGHGSDIYTNVADWKDVATLLKYSADEMNRVLKAAEPLVSDPASNRR